MAGESSIYTDPDYNELIAFSFHDMMTEAHSVSLSNGRAQMQKEINRIAHFLEYHAPHLNDTGATGDLSSGEIAQLGQAMDFLTNGIPVNYHSPLAAALDPAKVVKDLGDSARNAVKDATEGVTKGLAATAVKLAVAAALLLTVWAVWSTRGTK